MSKLVFPSTGGAGEGASITPPTFYTPAKLLQPRTTSQDLLPYTRTKIVTEVLSDVFYVIDSNVITLTKNLYFHL